MPELLDQHIDTGAGKRSATADLTDPATLELVRQLAASADSASVAFGTLAKAESVGAKTVNGPLPSRVPARPAFWSSEASLLNWPAPIAVWTRFFSPILGTAVVARPAVAEATPSASASTSTPGAAPRTYVARAV